MILKLNKMTLEDVTKGAEFLLVNVVAGFLVAHWDKIMGAFQFILVLSAIGYNTIKIYDWYVNKFKKGTKDKTKEQD